MSQFTDAHKIFGVPEVPNYSGTVVWKGEQVPPSHVAMFEPKMNHDAAHCLDWRLDCPRECYRAQLTLEVELCDDLKGIPLTWAFLGGSDECLKRKENHNEID